MKFLHLGDLHIGKRVNEFSMLEDQEAMLEQIAKIALEEDVDAVVVAGDFYDKPVPSERAVRLAGSFLSRFAEAGTPVLVVPGNHDSAERLSFLSQIIGKQGIHIAGAYEGAIECVMMGAGEDRTAFHLLPYVTPAEARRWVEGCEAKTFDEAVRAIMGGVELVDGVPNVMVVHQLVLGGREPIRADSEQASIGGIEEVTASAFDGLDYVALGHLHSPQWVEKGRIRYCGSPLKYSFSEVNQKKVANIVQISRAGAGVGAQAAEGEMPACSETQACETPANGRPRYEIRVTERVLVPMHDMVELHGTLPQIREQAGMHPEYATSYVRAVLEEPVSDAGAKLRDLFPLLMKVEFDYGGKRSERSALPARDVSKLDPAEVFDEFFTSINGREMSKEERELFMQVAFGGKDDEQ